MIFNKIIPMGYMPSLNGDISTSNPLMYTLNSSGSYIANMFYPMGTQAINRVAYKLGSGTNAPVMTLEAGISTVLSTGKMSTVFSASGTTTIHGTSDYTVISFSDFIAQSGEPYYTGVKVSSYTSGTATVGSSLANSSQINTNILSDRNTSIGVARGYPILYGYNNGSTTQWYGTPLYQTQSYTIGTSAGQFYEVGAKIALPYICEEYRVIGISTHSIGMNLGATGAYVCNIYDSDGTTQIVNATSIMSNVIVNQPTVGLPRKFIHFFGPPVVLKPEKTYWVSFAVASVNPVGLMAFYAYVVGSSTFDTSSCFEATNTLYTRTTAGGAVTENPYSRLEFDIILDDIWSPRRGGMGV